MDDARHNAILPERFSSSDESDALVPVTASMETTDRKSAEGFVVSQQPVATPELLGRYQLVCRVGRGGFGEVWKAFDPHLQRHVALKMPRMDRQFSPEACARFLEEGRKLARVAECDGIVTVYDAGESDGVAYIVSEFIAGGSLKDRMEKSPLAISESVALVIDIANALHGAHLKGLVHRDIKPGNVLMKNDAKPLIADFGLAVTEREQLHEPHYTVGTYAYVSPEQISTGSRLANPQADIYSLGVVLYELLTGRLPFISESVRDYKHQLLHRPPRPPRTVNDAIPQDLERIVLKCLAKEPTERYTTAADLASELKAALHGSPAAVVGTGANRKRRWWMFAGGLSCVAGVLLVGWQLGWFEPPQPDENPPVVGPPVVSPPGPQPEKKDLFVFQHWKDGELVTGRPYRLLRVEPTMLTNAIVRGGMFFDSGKETLHISTRSTSLLKLGTLNRGSYRLRLEIEQVRGWQGRAGVFLGVRETDQSGNVKRIRGQIIMIVPNSGREAKRFPLLAVRYRVGKDYALQYPSSTINYGQKLPRTETGRAIALELSVQNGWLRELRFGPHDLRELRSSGLNALFRPEDFVGSFGIITGATNGIDFRNAELTLVDD